MINRGSEDTLRDHPDAPRRTRRKSRLSVDDKDLAALRKHAAKLQAARVKAEAQGDQGTLL